MVFTHRLTTLRGDTMAGTKTGDFIELITPFLRRKMSELEQRYGMNSAEWRAIGLQYVKNPVEAAISPEERRRRLRWCARGL